MSKTYLRVWKSVIAKLLDSWRDKRNTFVYSERTWKVSSAKLNETVVVGRMFQRKKIRLSLWELNTTIFLLHSFYSSSYVISSYSTWSFEIAQSSALMLSIVLLELVVLSGKNIVGFNKFHCQYSLSVLLICQVS